MSEQRKKYTSAEKAKIAIEAVKSEMTLAQISSKYGVHSTQINVWKKQLMAYLPDAFKVLFLGNFALFNKVSMRF